MAEEALVSDDPWEVVEPYLLPPPPKAYGGPPRVPDRAALGGIVYVLRRGLRWRDLPLHLGCGSGVTCWRRLRRWQELGVWAAVHHTVLNWLGLLDAIAWDRASLDSTSIRAKRGGEATGPNPTDRGKPGSKYHVLVADALDRCADREDVARVLHSWALARRSTRVILMTRPAADLNAIFPGWAVGELGALYPHQQGQIALNIMRAEEPEHDAWEHYERFRREVNGNPTAAILADSPLLLGFLVVLSRTGGIRPFECRGQLFDRILVRWHERPSRGGEGDRPRWALASRTLASVGWHLQCAALLGRQISRRSLVRLVAPDLARGDGETALAREERAEQCVAFWETAGLLEDSFEAGERVTDFRHQAFREFTAGQYIAEQPSDVRADWLESAIASRDWEEVLVLAAGGSTPN